MPARPLLGPTIVLATLLVGGCGGKKPSATSTASATAPGATPTAVTAGGLSEIAASEGHPIYWAGPANASYELTRIPDGRTYVRYLPPGAQVGSRQRYLTIGTYIQPSAPYDAVRAASRSKRARVEQFKGGELVVQYPSRPQSVYMVFPGVRYEVEVYDPSSATAFRLATSGKVVPIR